MSGMEFRVPAPAPTGLQMIVRTLVMRLKGSRRPDSAIHAMLERGKRRRKLRRDLRRLDERLLRDAGISRQDLVIEAEKPFWRR